MHWLKVLHRLNDLRIMFARNETNRNYTFRGFILTLIHYSCNSVQMSYFHYSFQTVKLLHLFILIFKFPTSFWLNQLYGPFVILQWWGCHSFLYHPIRYAIFLTHNLSLVFKVAIWQLPFVHQLSALAHKLGIFTNPSYFKSQCQDTHTFHKNCIKLYKPPSKCLVVHSSLRTEAN